MMDMVVTKPGKKMVAQFLYKEEMLNIPDSLAEFSEAQVRRIYETINAENAKKESTENAAV